MTLSEIAGALKKIGVDAVYDTAQAENAARAKAEEQLFERLSQGGPVILADGFAAKAFLEKNFPEKKEQFLFCASPLAIFNQGTEGKFDKRFAFGPVGGDAVECEKTKCVDIAVNARELARIMIRTGAEPNPKRVSGFEDLGAARSTGRYGRLLEKASWNMEKEPEVFEQDGLRCAVCHNLGQARRLLESGKGYDVLRVIA